MRKADPAQRERNIACFAFLRAQGLGVYPPGDMHRVRMEFLKLPEIEAAIAEAAPHLPRLAQINRQRTRGGQPAITLAQYRKWLAEREGKGGLTQSRQDAKSGSKEAPCAH